MKVLRASFSIEGDNVIKQGPAIVHQGLVWLILGWAAGRTAGYAKPRRMIALDQFRLQLLPANNNLGIDAASNNPIPKGLFENPIPSQLAGKFLVLEGADIEIPESEVPRFH